MTSVTVSGFRPAFAALAAAAGVLATVAGCSSSGSSSTAVAAPSPSASAAASSTASGTPGTIPVASMTPLPAAAGQLTGTELESVLLPETDFPSGFATPTTGPITSGGTLTSGQAGYNLATISCSTFIQHYGTTGFGETAMVSGSTDTSGQAYDELIYQFSATSKATAFVSGVQALAGRCASFTVKANGESGTFSLRAAAGSPLAGLPTVQLQETGTLGNSKVVLNMLLLASGVDVFGASGVGVAGNAAPTVPAPATIVYELMRREAAEELLG